MTSLSHIRTLYEQHQRDMLAELSAEASEKIARRVIETGGLDEDDRTFWRSVFNDAWESLHQKEAVA